MSSQLSLDLAAPTAKRTGALRSFHVRSHVTVAEALAGESAAGQQEAAILAAFRTHWRGLRLTPSQVAAAFPRWPLTSVRARLTTLTTRGLLVHYPAERRPGPHGRSESVWGLA